MLCQANGVSSGSDYYFPTSSSRAKKMLYHIISCGHFVCEYGYSVKRNDYGCYLIMYVIRGSLSILTNGKRYTAKEDEVVFINCHEPHEYYATSYVEFEWLHLDGVNINDFYLEYMNTYGAVAKLPQRSQLYQNLTTITSYFRNNQFLSDIEISNKLYDCLCNLLDRSDKDIEYSIKNKCVLKALQYIKTNCDHNISVQEIASAVNLSPYHFSRQFKDCTGYSPYEYTIMCRLDLAKHLLRTTDLSIKEIAYSTGYNSETSFASSFANKVGIPPSRFREFQF